MILDANTITVVMPCYGNLTYTMRAIKSLQSKEARENLYFIIDNHPDHENATEIGHRFPRVLTYSPAENLGVAKSWDVGITHAPTDFVAVVNNDIEMVTDKWDEKLLEERERLGAAIICPWPYHPSALPSIVQQGHTEGLNGSFFLLSKQQIRETENYKQRGEYIDTNLKRAYWEDVDLLIQIRQIGLEGYVTERVQQVHFENITAGPMYPGGEGKDLNNPYWANLNYLNNKYGVRIWDYFKVHMSNVLHEETNKRLI